MTRQDQVARFKLLQYPNEPVGASKESLEHVRVLFDIQFKKRINYIEIGHCLIRIVMLYDSLKLP